MITTTTQTRRRGIGRHLRRNLVAYLALFIAVSMTPLPSWAAGQITSKQIANNTIKSKDVKNNNLKGVDIRDGSLTKVDLAAGSRGFTSIVTERVSQAIDGGDASLMNVVCPSGSVAIGGGAYVTPADGPYPIGATQGILERSHPSDPAVVLGQPTNLASVDGAAPRSWRTKVVNEHVSASTAYHYAICATK